MRVFEYVEPDYEDQPLTIRVTEADIINDYYTYWKSMMIKAGKGCDLTRMTHDERWNHCIDDFITLHWAQEIKT